MTGHELLEREILDAFEPRWVAEGYTVLRSPGEKDVPPFLGRYTPDALAIGKSPSLVVEVLNKGQRHSERRISQLRALVDGQPDWRLEVLYYGDTPQELAPIGADDLFNEMRHVEALYEAEPAAGLLLAWSLLEALARRLEPTKTVKAQSPGRVVEILASEGHIRPVDAERLRSSIDLRNRYIHGDIRTKPESAEVKALLRVISDLVTQVLDRDRLEMAPSC